MNKSLIAIALSGALLLGACQKEEEPAQAAVAPDAQACPEAAADGTLEIVPGLTATITKKGYGRAAQPGDYAAVHTTLWLYDEAADGGRGTEIWTSGGVEPFQFQLDAGQVIRGWDLGVACMLVGETRELLIAPELGYGARGKPPVPPNATLLFEISLVKLVSPE